MTSGIYEVYCSGNDKRYIGKSTDLEHRWEKHLQGLRSNTHYNMYLQRAFNKHGESSFSFQVVEFCDAEFLTDREIFYIKEMNAHRSLGGFNISWGGEGTNLSDETKRRMSKSMMGEKNPMFGRTHSKDAREKIRQARLGSTASEQTKIKMGKVRKGKLHSEEAKKKISKSHIGKIFSKKHRENLSRAKAGTILRKKRSGSSSIYFGVSYDKTHELWVGLISYHRIGYFKTEIDAAKAYNNYVIENNLPHPLNDLGGM